MIATYLSHRWGFPSAVTWWMPVYVFVALPMMAFSALKFGEAAMDIIKSLPPLVVSLIPGNEKQLENLRKRRAYLAEELNGVIGTLSSPSGNRPSLADLDWHITDTFGPEVFKDFNERRLRPAAGAPRSSQASSGTNPIEADGNNILSHVSLISSQ